MLLIPKPHLPNRDFPSILQSASRQRVERSPASVSPCICSSPQAQA